MNIVGLDFEFFNSNEETMKVIACVISYEKGSFSYNLLDKDQIWAFYEEMKYIKREELTLVAYAAIAEARALISLGIDPLQYKWIDLYVEFIMLCNSNNRYAYGNYLGSDGTIRFSKPANPYLSEEEREEDNDDHTETPKNLINCAYKMLGLRLDAEQKEAMRDLILSKDLVKIQENMEEILEYCKSDTIHLRSIYLAIQRAYEKEGLCDFYDDQLSRGRYAASVAKSETLGMPINIELLNKVIEQTPNILKLHEESVNGYFNFFIPETQRPPKTFKNGKIHEYKPTPAHKDMGAYQSYVKTLNLSNLPITKTGKFKSDKDTLEEWGYWAGLEALWKYNKTESSLKWFNKENKNGFFDRFGSDSNIRPYYGIFGTQTGRNAAKAKTFPLAMSSWLRAIIKPKKGEYIIGADFSQQEVYVAAILSGDDNLLQAYNSGDVYLAFAKQSGLVPEDATKTSHKLERMLCKATVLGLQFGMGHAKLKTKLKLDSGQEVSDEKTQELINAHKTTYSRYWRWVQEITQTYKAGIPLSTSDGWVLFCDNPVIPSVRNFLVQATAASITRLAVVMCWERGLKVMCSLHDAVYVLTENPKDRVALEEIMLYSTEKILKETRTSIRIDTKIIGHEDIWIEEKGEEDWNKLKGFLL